MEITTPLRLEDTDPELAALIQWASNNNNDIKDCRQFVQWQLDNPYELCSCESGKKNKFCKHGDKLTFAPVKA